MFEIVPSQWMKKCFEEIDFAFTDFQKATLIWNAPGRLRQEILDALEELSEETRDETLRRQINERLDYEKKAFEIFIHNQTGKYIYVVENMEYESCGFFIDYNRALRKSLKKHKEESFLLMRLIHCVTAMTMDLAMRQSIRSFRRWKIIGIM